MYSSIGTGLVGLMLFVGAPQNAPLPSKTILIELFTSHGCNMCPGAEQLLRGLADEGYGPDRVAILAWHVDYFNDPWVDPFSKKEHSARNWAYNEAFKKRDRSAPDLYFTPMIMVNGRYPTSGYYNEGPPAARRALHERLDRAIQDPVEAEIELGRPTPEGNMVKWTVSFRPLSNRLNGREVLLVAVVAEDGISTSVPSGENAGKTLVEKWVVRSFQHQKVSLKKTGGEVTIDFALEPNAKAENTRVVVFLQDDKSGAILATIQSPWAAIASPANSPSK